MEDKELSPSNIRHDMPQVGHSFEWNGVKLQQFSKSAAITPLNQLYVAFSVVILAMVLISPYPWLKAALILVWLLISLAFVILYFYLGINMPNRLHSETHILAMERLSQLGSKDKPLSAQASMELAQPIAEEEE